MKNKILSIVLCIVLCFILSLPSFAISPYSSVTQNTSQVQILYSYMRNIPEFDPMSPFYILRTGEYEYFAYYNINGSYANYIRYYRSNVSNIWFIDTGGINNFELNNINNYTIVGNQNGSLAINENNEFIYQYVLIIAVFFIMFGFLFFVFRVHKRGINI